MVRESVFDSPTWPHVFQLYNPKIILLKKFLDSVETHDQALCEPFTINLFPAEIEI